ncbi:MYXO-CTERM domain-containing protein [Paenibacillus rhizosphaerae]|uniref:MYXO-CTERM domain-containing protein n=1 Tax=Paenibacillus rhizosphaerae TaxID=297318 RepID=A0A839TUD6_9BACL|nr:WGxxGxxG family protein [Paenibacillus rhizosphaerae]MBB3130415.1 MYXO-CTERM domain-containing protein [Paenibacillus rhizosphaerae]
MRQQLRIGVLIAGMSLMLAAPAFAYGAAGTAQDGGNGGMGTGMGTGTIGTQSTGGSQYRVNNVGTTSHYHVSVYGTGTGSQYLNTNYGTNNTGRMGTNSYTGSNTNMLTDNNRIRTNAATDTNRGGGWGWLGLLGLIGLAGMRKGNPERDRG